MMGYEFFYESVLLIFEISVCCVIIVDNIIMMLRIFKVIGCNFGVWFLSVIVLSLCIFCCLRFVKK